MDCGVVVSELLLMKCVLLIDIVVVWLGKVLCVVIMVCLLSMMFFYWSGGVVFLNIVSSNVLIIFDIDWRFNGFCIDVGLYWCYDVFVVKMLLLYNEFKLSMRWKLFFVLILLWLFLVVFYVDVKFEIIGISGVEKDNVEVYFLLIVV